MQMHPYLIFDGQCEEAFKFYERCLNGRIEMIQTHGESPIADQVPPESHDRILHVRLVAGDAVLMGSDSPPELYEKPQGTHVSLNVDSPAEADRIFNTLAENGKVTMPIAETFWAARFGMLVDRFGTPWMINCEQGA